MVSPMERMMLLAGALVDTLHENVVELLGHGDLCMLQFGQGIDHNRIMEVLLNHSLKKG